MENKTKILIVDDDDSVRRCMRILFAEDFDVYLAEDGKKALEIQEKNGIRIIITDILMPDMDGVELCKRIRERDHACLIYAMSTITESMAGVESPDIEFNGYITSPPDMEVIKSMIKEAKSKLLETPL